MAGRLTTFKNTVADALIGADNFDVPTEAEYTALDVGSTMKARRIMGTSLKVALKRIANYTKFKRNLAPVVAIGLVDQTLAEQTALNYQFAAGSFTDAQTITYTALSSDGSALPGWITFTAGTRTFTGTAPIVATDTVYTIDVFGTDSFGIRTKDTFTITVTAVA